jgi:hypothetical protein
MLLQILTHTPLWVFFLLAVLLAFGLLQARSRSVKRSVAYLLPAGMIFLSFFSVQSNFGMKLTPIFLWALGLAFFTFLCSKFFPLKGASYDTEEKTFFLPGTWAPLVVIMGIFVTKYAVAVMHGLHVAFVDRPLATALLSLAYGGFSGYFAARALNLIAVSKGPDNWLKPKPLRGAA